MGTHNFKFENYSRQSYSNQDSKELDEDRHVDQWDIIASLEANPQIYGELIFNKVPVQFSGEKNF